MMDALQPMGMTRWHNPTNKTLRIRLWVGANKRNPSGRQVVEFGPGETKEIPSSFDTAVQKVRHGRIVGGVGPQLVRAGTEPVPIDPALDAEAAERKANRDAVRDAAALKAQAEAQLAEAALKADEAQKAAEAGEAGSDDGKSKPKATQRVSK